MPDAPAFAPALEQVAAWQHALGRARSEAQSLPDVFVVRRFERAVKRVAAELRRVEESEDVDAALLDALERARDGLSEARELLTPIRSARGAVERTSKLLAAIDKALAEARLPTADAAILHSPAPPPLPPLRGSRGVPQCFAIEREVVVPGRRTREMPDLDDVDPSQAWRAFPPPGPAPAFAGTPSAPSPRERAERHVQRLLEAAFAELGALGWLRRSRDDDAWYEGVERFEERLLAELDAIMATSQPVSLALLTERGWTPTRIAVDLPEALLRWSEDAVPGDTSRAFCRALVLGCLRGADSARAAVEALDAPTGLDRRAAVEALALASSLDVDAAIAEACRAPRIAASALEVARRRATTDVAGAVAALAGRDVKVAESAARALGSAPERELAAATLEHALDAGLDPQVACSACESALRLGADWAMRRIREHARHTASDDAMLTRWLGLLALSSDRGDALVLRERAGDDVARLEAWGYAGRVELADALLERIEGYPGGITPRTHLAIFERITGIAPSQPFDARALRAGWTALRGSLDSAVRYRRGRALSLEVALEELGTFGRLQRERRVVSLEVAVLSRGALRIDPDDWSARQRARIALALAELRRVT
jgi:hypothetical protein